MDDYPTDGFYAYSLASGYDLEQVRAALRNVEGVAMIDPYYLTINGQAFNSGPTFVVGFRHDVTQERVDALNEQHHVIVEKISRHTPSVYVLSISQSSEFGLLEMANLYYGIDETYFSHPNTAGSLRQTAYTLDDKYHTYQWNVMQVIGNLGTASVWDFAGLTDSLVVAVVDDGVTGHYDLDQARILPGYDFADDDDDPSPGDSCGHGMGCTGLIAANHTIASQIMSAPDYSGVMSLNPHVSILPVKIFRDYRCSGQGVSLYSTAEAIHYAWQHGADVLSNSWICEFSDIVWMAIDSAAIRGRDGKGCTIVFASGNDAIAYPERMSWLAILAPVIGVGACDQFNDRLNYSMYGINLGPCGPQQRIVPAGNHLVS
ncbi:MAG: S8 family serine peptidase [Candidatus Zixiibacteriota bacterium]